jgi:hypothetical protein
VHIKIISNTLRSTLPVKKAALEDTKGGVKLTSDGKLFQILGAAAEKVRSPTVDWRAPGTVSNIFGAE